MNLYTTILSWLIISSVGQAAEFAGGTGDPNNPFQIANSSCGGLGLRGNLVDLRGKGLPQLSMGEMDLSLRYVAAG